MTTYEPFENLLETTTLPEPDEDTKSSNGSVSSSSEFTSDAEDDIEALTEELALNFNGSVLNDAELARGIKFLAEQLNREKKLRDKWERCQAELRAAVEEAERQRVCALEALLNMPPEEVKIEDVTEPDCDIVAGLARLPRYCTFKLDAAIIAQNEEAERLQARREELFCMHRHQNDGVYSLGPVYEGEDVLKRLSHTYFRAVHVGAILDNLFSMEENRRGFCIEQFAFHTIGTDLWGPLEQHLALVRDIAPLREEHLDPMCFASCPTFGSESPGGESSANSSSGPGYVLPALMRFREMIHAIKYKAFLEFFLTDPVQTSDESVVLTAFEYLQGMKRVAEQQVEPGRSFADVGAECVCGRLV